MATRMQQRRGTATQWTAADPILAAGEIGFESDSGKFKIGDGINHWSSLSYFADASDFDTSSIEASIATAVTNAVNGLVDNAPAALNTLKEIADSINNDSSFSSTIVAMISALDGTLSTHTLGTTNVHGIADTSLLATKDYAETVAGTAQENAAIDATNKADLARSEAITEATAEAATDATAKADAALQDAKDYTDGKASSYEPAGAVTTHNNLGQNVHGIADTAELVTNSVLETATTDLQATLSDYADTVAGDAQTAALAAAATDAASKVSTHNSATTSVHGIADTAALATKTYVDTADALLAPKANPTFTGTISGITKSMVGLGNVDNTADSAKPVSTATQTALDLKANLAAPTFTGTVVLPSTTSIGNVSATEIGYVDGVTSAIQTQLDAKAPKASPTFTGTTTAADVTITGNLTVSGTTTTVSANNLVVDDSLIYLADQNTTSDALDIGVYGAYSPTGTGHKHTGLFRDASDSGKWKLISNGEEPSSNVIDLTGVTYDTLVLGGLEATSATIGNVSNTELQYLDGVTSAIQTQINAKAPSASPTLATPTITGALTLSSSGVVFTDGTQTKVGVPSLTTIQQKTANYTLSALTERDNMIEMGSSSALTFTVPADSTVNYPVGTSIDILQTSTGQVTVAGAGGVTVNATPGLKLRTQWSSATLTKRAANTWVLTGDLSA